MNNTNTYKNIFLEAECLDIFLIMKNVFILNI